MYAEALHLLRKPKEAVAELTKILDQHPDDVRSYEKMGILANDYPDVVSKPAALWFDDAIAKNPRSALAYLARAEFYLRNSRGDDAQADLEQAQKCDLPDTETRGRLVGGLMNTRLLDQTKEQPKAARLLDQAREQLKAWQAQAPAEPVLWQCWTVLASRANGMALRAKDPAVLARSVEEMYTVAQAGLKALAAQPWDFMPGATELLILSDHIEEARNCIAQMQQKDIAPQVTPYLEGLIADREGRLRDAITDWRKAIALGYRHPAVRRMLASALVRLGDTQSAIGELRILLTDVPGYLDAHVALAQLLVQTAEWQDALEQARIAHQISPDYTEAILLELQARLHLPPVNGGPEAEREKAWQDIETQLAQLDKTEKGSLTLRLLQARVALMRGKFPEATSLLTDLEGKYPSEVRVVLLEAESYAVQGKKEEAKTQFQKAVTKFPQAFEAVRGLALFLNQPNQRQDCESAIKEGLARIQEPRSRRELGLMLTELYRQWGEENKLVLELSDLAAQFPSDIQLRRRLLTCSAIMKDLPKMQSLVDEIKSLEGDGGWQWRFEQAKLWSVSTGEEFKTRYPQIVKLLQENLLTNPKDDASRFLLAQTYEKANELPLAATTYQEVQRAMPRNVPILVHTITVLNKVKDYDAVRRLLDQADQLNIHNPDLNRLRLRDDLRTGQGGRGGGRPGENGEPGPERCGLPSESCGDSHPDEEV